MDTAIRPFEQPAPVLSNTVRHFFVQKITKN
jgi:hypothetical protein